MVFGMGHTLRPSFGEDLIMPQQPYAPFAREIDQRLRPLGLSLIRVDAAYTHFLNGGLHCNASVVRTCRAKPSHRQG
jgi:hypothetical protein